MVVASAMRLAAQSGSPAPSSNASAANQGGTEAQGQQPTSEAAPGTQPESQAPIRIAVEVTVTATSRDSRIADAPSTVTVVQRDQIDARNVSRLGDALNHVPSLHLESTAFGQSPVQSGTTYSLRGLDSRRIGVMADGVPLQDAFAGTTDFHSVLVDDIDRIEVVPGAFSSLYGSNAIGGVINVLSKKPTQRELTARMRRGFGDARGTDGSVYFRRHVLPRLGVAAGIGIADRDSYINEFTTRPVAAGAPGTPVTGAIRTTTREGLPAFIIGDRNRSPFQQKNAIGRLSYDLGRAGALRGDFGYSRFELGFTPFNTYLRDANGNPVSSGVLGIDGTRVTVSEVNFASSAPAVEGSRRFSLGYEGIVKGRVNVSADVTRIDRDRSFVVSAATGATASGGPGTQNNVPNFSDDGSVRAGFVVGRSNYLVTGAAWRRDHVELRVYRLANWRDPATRQATNSGYNGNTATRSIFVQDEFALNSRVTLIVGGRYDRVGTEGDYFQNTTPLSALLFPLRAMSAFSPKASGVVRLTGSLTAKASIGGAFRAPSNNDLYSTSVTPSSNSLTGFLTTRSDPSLQPEAGSNAEGALDWRPSTRFFASSTVYQVDLTNLITNKNIDTSLTQRINSGQARIRGLELATVFKPFAWLDLGANYAYVDSEVLKSDADPASVGKRLPVSPKHLASLSLGARRGDISGVFDVKYNSRRFVTSANTDVIQGVPGSYDAMTVASARVGYRLNEWAQAYFAVNNVFDVKAYTNTLIPGANATLELVLGFK